jgi:hypothetical protein
MSLLLVIAGLVFMAIGAILIFRPPPQPPQPPADAGAPSALPDIGEWIKQIKELLQVFQQNVRTGMAVMILGLILVSLGIYLEVRQTKDAVEETPPAAFILRL